MRELTRAEEQIMQILWDIEKGFVKDVLEKMTAPKPAYNTVSTIIRILERKGFVKHKAYGKSHEYYPIVSKDEYRSFTIKNLLTGYFSGSFANLASFFAKDEQLDIKALEKIMAEVKDDVKDK
ncbi:BlaI/MecI/CopY family transcriptional regulator [Cyclobacterium amurskyense]|jgi:predicted transcriptional regulator|uniref:Transcriptional regulator, MecI family n=1 Tax=Cyclobacterium amurskyense TaxID=320787 RepID=A0A0H4PMG0_9BACT|nr:BlaI/MecI/CopY family transcriptional regulator [Cyclobacterium amurskyense]AKP54245.1 Transcriptional regulator, MecI family [Cyclobacterium amurskyense]|tara:strand:- start:15061 stop:15429 length:369 start_codon:yes stop_codon:yes gene_type:complete